jgi:hypothetical protein
MGKIKHDPRCLTSPISRTSFARRSRRVGTDFTEQKQFPIWPQEKHLSGATQSGIINSLMPQPNQENNHVSAFFSKYRARAGNHHGLPRVRGQGDGAPRLTRRAIALQVLRRNLSCRKVCSLHGRSFGNIFGVGLLQQDVTRPSPARLLAFPLEIPQTVQYA